MPDLQPAKSAAAVATATAVAAADRLAVAVGAASPQASSSDARAALLPFTSLFAAVILLVLGSGLLGILIPVRATLEGFPTVTIGLFGTAYYVGFVAGCARVPGVLGRVGHIRAFAAFAAVAASAALAHALLVNVAAWIALRVVAGFCFAGLYTVIESWLNDRTPNGARGRVMAAYMAVNMGAVTAGKMLLAADDPATGTLFALVGIAICLSLVPVALTRTLAPSPPQEVRLRIGRLYRLSPVGVVGCLFVGAANGAFWTMAPVFAQVRFESSDGVALFMTVAVVGGALAQWPLGRLSDRMDRRRTIVAGCLAAVAAALGLAILSPATGFAVLGIAFAFGVFALPLQALCVAHANDFVAPDDVVEASSELLMMFGLGAIAGPLVASSLMTAAGVEAVFLFTAAMHVALAAFVAYRITRRASMPPEERPDFVALPMGRTTSPTVFQLDPRAGDDDPDAHPGRERSPA
jgi:MFS family permease